MADFNSNDYFAKRFGRTTDESPLDSVMPTPPVTPKLDALVQASAEKVEALRQYSAEMEKRQTIEAKTLTNRLGLDADSFAATAVNLGANVAEGIVNIPRFIGSSIHTIRASALDQHIPDEVKLARSRQLAGEATPEDLALMALPEGETTPNAPLSYYQSIARKQGGFRTNQERIESMEAALSDAQTVRELMDVSSIVNRGKQETLQGDLRSGFQENAPKVTQGWEDLKDGNVVSGASDIVSGVAGLLANIGTSAVNNPAASAEYIAANLPQIGMALAGGTGMALTNIPYAIEEFGKGIEEYKKKNNGAIPPEDKMREMAAYAASLALAETVGDKLVIGADKLLGKSARKVATDVLEGAEQVAADVARKSFKSALYDAGKTAGKVAVDSALGRVVKATAKGSTGEFITEGYQTFAENQIQDKDTSAEDVYLGGSIGAIAGGGLSAGISTAEELTKPKQAKAETKAPQNPQNEAVAAAISAGDISALTDPKQPSYAPEKAVAVLYETSKAADATPEVKQTNLEQAGKIVSDLEAQKAKIEEAYSTVSPEGIANYQTQLEATKAKLAEADPVNVELQTNLQEQVTMLEEAIADASSDTAAATRLKSQLDTVNKQLEVASTTLGFFVQDTKTKDVDVAAQAAIINQPADTQNTQAAGITKAAVDTVINLAMSNPERIDTKIAEELVANTSNALTTEQRNYLRALTTARIAENKLKGMKGVSKEIYEGSDNNIGIAQYRDRIGAALLTKNQKVAKDQLGLLIKFAKDHQAKATAAWEAMSKGKGNQIVRTTSGNWELAKTPLTPEQITENGGLTLNSQQLVDAIVTEADALTKVANELKAAYSVKFGTATAPVASPVPAATATPAASTESAPVAAKGAIPTEATTAVTQEAPASSVTTPEAGQPTTEGTTEGSTDGGNQEGNVDERIIEETKTEEVKESRSPVLKGLQAKSPEGSAYQDRNLLGDFFTQVAQKTNEATARPLAAVKDFMSKVVAGEVKITDFIKNVDTLTVKQQAALRMFFKKASEWQKTINKNVIKGGKTGDNPKFYFQDLMQFLATELGDGVYGFEENVRTAISLAAYQTIIDEADQSPLNTPKRINSILLRDQDTQVTNEEYELLGRTGVRENVWRNAAGRIAVQALGLNTSNAPKDLLPRLESAFGAHIEKLLMDAEIIERQTLSKEQVTQLLGESNGRNKEQTAAYAATKFLRLAWTKEDTLPSNIQEIVDTNAGSSSILDKLFGTESALKYPSLEPIPFTQKTTGGTKDGIPKNIAEAVEEKQKTPMYMRDDMWRLFNLVSDEAAYAMAGVVDTSEKRLHVVNRKSVEAKNNGLIREYQRYKEYVSSTLEQEGKTLSEVPLYLPYNVWVNQRVGIASTIFNPQTSKIHRFMAHYGSWKTQVDMSNQEAFDNFKLRVAEGMGANTDKEFNAQTLESFDALFDPALNTDPKAKAKAEARSKAIDVLVSTVMEGNDMNQEQEAALVAGVKAGGENIHSLDGLMAMAQMRYAQANGRQAFETTLVGEVDGVANGPILSLFLMGAGVSIDALLNMMLRGGFFTTKEEQNQYNLWKSSTGGLDLYEVTAQYIVRNVRKLLRNKEMAAIANRIEAFTGALEMEGKVQKEGRNVVKTTLTPLMFGSSVETSISRMGDKFVANIYERIENAANNSPYEDPAKIIDDINFLLASESTKGLNPRLDMEQLLEVELSPEQVKALKSAFNRTLGGALRTTIKQVFPVYLLQRDQLNRASQLTFDLFDSVYQGIRSEYIQELIQAEKEKPGTGIAVDGKGNPLHDLNTAQERTLQQRINKLIPMMHTSNSKMDGRLSTGVFLGENTSKLSTDPIYQSVVKFATPFKDTVGKKPAFSAYTNSQKQAFEGPGVRMPSQTAHSFDSGVSHDSQLGREVTNVHDAFIVGLNGLQDAAKALNKNTWKHLMNYSPMAEAFNTMARMVSNLSSFMEQETLSPASVANLKVILEKYAEDQKVPVEQVLEHMLTSLKMQAYQADHKKFGGLAQVVAVDQYAFEGGNYLVSEAERKEAADAQANLSEIVPEALLNQAKQITQQVLAADTKGVAVTKQDAGTSIPKDLMEDTDSLFELPAVEALQLLRMAVALPDSNMANLANQVLSAMTASGSNLAKAAAITLSKKQREALAVQLMALYNQVPENYFGALGVPYIESDPLLVNYFNKAPAVTVGRVLNMLQTRVKEQGNTIEAKANLVLIQELQKRADPSLTIRMITPSSYPQMALEKSATNARGWYVLKNDKQGIYVLSPDFVDSGLTVETLLHEITHSVVASLVDQEIQAKKANPNHSSEASKYVAELEMLRTKAAEYVATLSKEAQTTFNAAVGNTQEFIAWGMSNTKFQNEVLKNITMESKTVKGLVSGMKAFIDNLIGALFKGASLMRKEVATNGLTVLVANVSGLFEQASMTNPRASNINQAQENTAAIDIFTTLDIHEALNEGKIDPTFDEHLRGLLAGIVEKLHGPFGAMAQAMKRNAAATPLDAWLKAKETEQATFASQVLGKYPASQQEAFAIAQVEATVKAALEDNAAETKVAYKQLYNLYTEARNKLKPSDFASQEQYDFVFKIEKNNGDRSDYLARFAALGLAHQEFNSKLQFSTQFDTRKLSDAKTFADKLQMLFEKILAYFNDKIARTYQGQNADQKLEALVSTLVDIEAKKRTLLKLRQTEKSYLAPIEEGVKSLTEGLRYKVGQIAGSDFAKNSASGFVRGASGIARTIANDRVDQFMAGLGKLYDREVKGRQGIVGGLLREMTGYKEAFQVLLRAEKVREGTRKDIITNRSKLVLKTFAQGKKLSKESKKAVTNVVLRTGFHTLTDHFTLPELASLVEDRDALNKAITRFENSLTSPLKNQHIQQANTLGYYKATGLVQGFLMMNAHVIARMMGTQFNGQITEQEANQAEGNIKALVALYALRYTKQEHLNKAAEVFRTESQRTDGNGVEFTLALHKQLEQDSLEKVFKNNPTLMVHGYTPEILNSHTDIKIVDEVEGKELIDLGYSKGDMVARDPLDTSNKQQHIYVLRDGGLMPYLSGAISLSSMAAKGSKIYHGTANNKGTVASILNQKLKALSTNQVPNRDLSKEKTANMAPVYNENGDIVDWRYLMKEETKDDLLERDNRFENILGVLAASTFDKQSSVEQNRQVLQALYEDASANYADSPESYVDVGPASADPELREIWKMLPPATKAMIRSIWGSGVLKIRSDSLDIIFGYRKNSLADAFKEVYEEQKRLEKQGTPEARAKARSILNPAQQALVFGIEWALINYARVKLGKTQEEAENYAKKAAVMITKGERVWQELVRETKDIIVVKTGMVMVGNIWSNLSMLLLSGVSFKEMKQHHMIAMKAATAYIQGSEELEQYKTLLATGHTQGKEAEIETNILRLEDALARNPVKELIDAGLMPTIVEDVAADEDIYSYKSAFARAVDVKTSKLNPKVKQAAKLVYMSRDTKMYQGLSRITQLSDFVARYTLYQHLINRKNNPLSKEAAIQKASDYFVNYDIPMQRNLQYMDDMGLLMFTKYFLRIQKPLLEMSRENPARVLLAVVLGNFMALGPIVLEGSALTRIGNNPLTVGALNYPSTLDDLATVNATMALVK